MSFIETKSSESLPEVVSQQDNISEPIYMSSEIRTRICWHDGEIQEEIYIYRNPKTGEVFSHSDEYPSLGDEYAKKSWLRRICKEDPEKYKDTC